VLRLEYSDGSPFPLKAGNTWFQVMSDISQSERDGETWTFDFILRQP